jgi:hypothetical protein
MSKKVELPQTRRHILIFDEDWEYLTESYGAGGAKPIGVSAAIRKIVHAKVLGLRDRVNSAIDASRSSSSAVGASATDEGDS